MRFPGDKSISHRALMLAALANGTTIIHNFATGADVESTRLCLAECGIYSKKMSNSTIVFGGRFQNPKKPLNAGNSGTTARLLTGLLVGQGISAKIIGDKSLSARPMFRIIDPLRKMGAKIRSNNGKLPIHFEPSGLSGIHFSSTIASAQVKSTILFAGLGAKGKTSVCEPFFSRNHTEILFKELGLIVDIPQKNTVSIEPLKTDIQPFEITLPGDPSTAAFFAAASAIIPRKQIILEDILINPTRTGFFSALKKMGGDVTLVRQRKNFGEIVGDIKISYQPLQAIQIGPADIPQIIDEIPILAVLATQAKGTTIVRGAKDLRNKETDRIHAIVVNLRKMGAKIEEFHDGFAITGNHPLHSAKIQTFGDHRIAMAFAVTGLMLKDPLVLNSTQCVDVSFPSFFKEINHFYS